MTAVKPQISLVRNVASALGGNSVYALCQFGMLSGLAILTDTAAVGRYALALAVTAPVFLFAGLKLRQVQVTDAKNDFSFGEYLGQRLLASALAAIGIVALAGFFHPDEPTYLVVVAVTVYKALESVIDILYGAMQRREQLHLVARSQIWRGLSGLMAFIAVVAWTKRVELAVTALALLTLIQLFSSIARVRRLGVRTRPTFAKRALVLLTRMALPLGVAVSVSSLSVNVPRYLIQGTVGTAELGIFAALAYVLTVTGMIVNSVGQAASPRLANLFFAGELAQFRVTLRKLVLLGCLIGIAGVVGVVLFGRPVLALVFGQEYAAHTDVLIVMMAAAAVAYTTIFLGTAVNAMRHFTVQLPINIFVLAAVTLAAWFLIPRMGIIGGALAMAAGEVVSLLCYSVLVRRILFPAAYSVAPSSLASETPRHMANRRKRSRG